MVRARRLRAGRPRRRRGATAVELAAILPVLALIVMGCVDFGRFLYYYVAVTNAARAGAAYGIMNNFTSSTKSAWQTAVQTTAQNEMTGMTGYSSSNLTVTVSSSQDSSPQAENGLYRTTVTASYPFNTITKWPGIPSSITMARTVQMRSVR